MSNKFYITTTLPYINSKPHIGFAAEIIKADMIARYQRFLGKEVIFNTGTDEHGLKIYRKAQERGVETKKHCDEIAQEFKSLKDLFNLTYTHFIRTTDEKHKEAAKLFWTKCLENGDIYKKKYSIKYCVGCELEKTDSELVDGKCPLHPNQELELIDEENYFFAFSKYQGKLLKLYEEVPDFVKPKHRLNEIKSFVSRGLKDFSISRLKEKMPWGVEVPGDDEQVMYVWFDALVNYISTLSWPEGREFNDFWPGIQVAGKDNLRQQSAMFQAMLMSAGVKNSKKVLIFGFLTNEGQKISKSLGNTINLNKVVNEFGSEAIRYYLLSAIPTYGDGDFSKDKLIEMYNADLANGLGNLAARLANLIEKDSFSYELFLDKESDVYKEFCEKMNEYKLQEAIYVVWKKIREVNEYLSSKAPWKEEDIERKREVLGKAAQELFNLSHLVKIFLPESGERLIKQFSAKQIKKSDSLFPRLKIEDNG